MLVRVVFWENGQRCGGMRHGGKRSCCSHLEVDDFPVTVRPQVFSLYSGFTVTYLLQIMLSFYPFNVAEFLRETSWSLLSFTL